MVLMPASLRVEVDVSGIKTDEDYFHTVGFPQAAVRQSRDRVRAAPHGMTVANLQGAPAIEPKHIAEAIQYRTLDHTFWA
jgi:predicted ATPase with chaperone activity